MVSQKESRHNRELEVTRKLFYKAMFLYSRNEPTDRITISGNNLTGFSNRIITYYLRVTPNEPIATAFCLTDPNKERTYIFDFVPEKRLEAYRGISPECIDFRIDIDRIDMPKRLSAVRKRCDVVRKKNQPSWETYIPRIFRTSRY